MLYLYLSKLDYSTIQIKNLNDRDPLVLQLCESVRTKKVDIRDGRKGQY